MSSAVASGAPPVGTIVSGKYRVEQLLGAGGMGAVFAARNTLTGKRVALKWMHAELATNAEASRRFLREAQASARVRHPNVVDVYDVVNENGALFLVMELLEGEPLTRLMEREGTPLPLLISYVLGAMRGVAAAHREHVIHRDIKPDNIFLAREGDGDRPVPKVLDFGISKLTGAGDLSVTNTGAALGTPLYMSVEQLSGVKDIDGRTDVYAFGVILYEAVTGRPPFEADTYAVLVAKIMTGEAADPKQIRPDVPASLARLIARAMAKDRTQRIPNLDTLIRELEPFATETGFVNQMTISGRSAPAIWTPSSRPPAASATSVRAAAPNDTFDPVSVNSAELGHALPLRTRARLLRALAALLLLTLVAIGLLLVRNQPSLRSGATATPILERTKEPVSLGRAAGTTKPAVDPAHDVAREPPSVRAPEPSQVPAGPAPAPSTASSAARQEPLRAHRPVSAQVRGSDAKAPAPVAPSPAPLEAPAAPAAAAAPPSAPTVTPAQEPLFRAGRPTRKQF